jgi:hypothetical protein
MAKLVLWFVLFLAAAGPAVAQSASSKPPAATNQFTTEQAAKAHCPGDTIVWATLSRAKVFHLSGDRYYGKTRRGAYMCQQDAVKAGMHQAGRRGTPPSGGAKSGGATTH